MCICIWISSYGILTGHRQNSIIKAIKKKSSCNWAVLKKRHQVRAIFLGGMCKEEVFMGGPLPSGASRLSHSLGIPMPRVLLGGDAPVFLLGNALGQIAGSGQLDSALDKCTHAGLPTIRAKMALHWWLPSHSTSQSKGVNTQALFSPH